MTAHMLEDFKSNFRGEVLLPEDGPYDCARAIWNGMFDRKPAVIARCVGTRDVIQAVNYAREQGLTISVKGGGHNSAGNAVCDDGMMIDLSLMRRVHVDPDTRRVRVDGGCLLADVDAETQLHGLAVSGGIVSHTGVGGLTLGGGFGWISRKYGFSIDNLLSVEMVLADGRFVRADKKEHAHLFWAIRGGGGNFGIVTSFEYEAAKLGPDVYSGIIAKKFCNAAEYLRFHRDYLRTLPDEMTVWLVTRHAPPLPFLPEEVHGAMIVAIPFVWLGAPEEGAQLIQPIRDATETVGEGIGMNPWVDWQAGFDGLCAHGARNYWKSHHLKALSDDCIDILVDFAGRLPTDECEIFIPHMEGAPSRVPVDATAFAHRKTPFVLNIHTRWRSAADDARCLAWARELHAATEPYAQGVYVNFMSEEGRDRVKDAYTPEVWKRLVETKRRYDPENLFHMNQNIAPD